MIDDDVVVHIDSSVGMIDFGITALINNEIVTYVMKMLCLMLMKKLKHIDPLVISYVDNERSD